VTEVERTSSTEPSDGVREDRAASGTARAIDLPNRDLTLDLARVFCVLLVVAIHMLMIGVGTDASGAIVVSRPIDVQPWFDAATWLGQIMPLFFVVGGFASLTAWRSLRRRDGSAADYVRGRILRLAMPTLPLFLFYVVALGGALLAGVDPAFLDAIATGAGSPLWFIAAYALTQSFVPFMAGCHARAPRATLAVLLAGVVLVDAARYGTGITEIGLLNLFFVWILIQQLGFFYADGWFARRTWWQLAALAAACYLALWPLVSIGWYHVDMLDNLNPPTLPLVALGLAQACLLRLAHPALAALMSTRPARAVVFVVGSRLMTIYLWHLPVIIALSGVALLIPGAAPQPGSEPWWWSRIAFFAVVLAVVLALSLVVGRWEAPGELGATPPTWVVGLAAALTFIPAFAVLQWFLDFGLAVLGAVSLSASVFLLRRPWPVRG
jgi:fucose 4-O-acetylase-like acetyltransferase